MTIRGLEPGRRAALIINECQNAMLDLGVQDNVELAQQATERKTTQRIAALADACRHVGVPVVHSTIVFGHGRARHDAVLPASWLPAQARKLR
jgi:nicotinamidase-related amidase